MDTESLAQTESLINVVQDQVDIFLAALSRPIVQGQILIVLLILAVTWLLPKAVRRWRLRKSSGDEAPETETSPSPPGWLFALYHLLTPILALILLHIAIRLFDQQGYPHGLLEEAKTLIWLWLLYRLLITLLYTRFGESSSPYRNWILTPILLFLAVWQISSALATAAPLLEVTINLGSISFTLRNLLSAFVVLYLFLVAAWIIKPFMVHYMSGRLSADPGVVASLATLIRYVLVALGLVVSLGVFGLDYTSLALIAGGLSVGIGIGMQDLVSNFVSGLVLVVEQSLRPGDVVELDDQISQVENISFRATTVRTRANEELIIPNSIFTNQQVKNLTRSDRRVQVLIHLGVGYKSDPELVKKITIETALQHPLVLPVPQPSLIFRAYGDSSLDFDLSVAVNRPELSAIIRSDIYYMLWQTFSEHAIEIPFPQRDVNLRVFATD